MENETTTLSFKEKLTHLVSAHKRQTISVILLLFIMSILYLARVPLFSFLEGMEANHFSGRQRQITLNREDSGIKIIQITGADNNEAFNDLFGKYPYTRNIHGYIIRFLNRTTPKSVVYNISFGLGKDKNKDNDLAFSDSIKKAPYKIVTGLNNAKKRPSNSTSLKKLDALLDGIKLDSKGSASVNVNIAERMIIFPLKNLVLDHASDFGMQQTIVSDPSTRTVRSARLLLGYRPDTPLLKALGQCDEDPCHGKSVLIPSLVLSPFLDASRKIVFTEDGNLLVGDEKSNQKHFIDTQGQDNPIIRWYGNAKLNNPPVYPVFNEWDIIKSQIAFECQADPQLPVCNQVDLSEDTDFLDPNIFKEQHVIVGFVLENFDSHKTIYGSNYPGLFINANIIDNVLHNDFIEKKSTLWTLMISMALLLIVIPLCLKRSIILSLIFSGLIAAAYTLFTFYAYKEMNLWINWIYPIITIITATALSYVYRILIVEKEKEELAVRINIDPLTQLYNKGYFLETLSSQLEAVKTLNSYLALIFVDLDHFKKLNDTYGHNFGDKVLIAAGKKMQETGVRHDELNVCRYGGEEITVIVAGKIPEQVEQLAQDMCDDLRTLRFEEHPEVIITASFGVNTIHFTPDKKHHNKTIDQIVELADQEVYRSKMNGRDQISSNDTGEVQGEILKEPPRAGDEPLEENEEPGEVKPNIPEQQSQQRLKSALKQHLKNQEDLTLPENNYKAFKDSALETDDDDDGSN